VGRTGSKGKMIRSKMVSDKTKNIVSKDKIILPLDVASYEEAMDLVNLLKDYVGMFKVGMQLFTGVGPEVVKAIISLGGKIFLDLKYHDIPNTVAKASVSATEIGVDMFTIHVSGGREMMKRVVEESSEIADKKGLKKPVVLGITLLTSLDKEAVQKELKMSGPTQEIVLNLASMAKECGLNGVVASPKEIESIKKRCGDDFLVVTPGVRPSWAEVNDQKRVSTPKEALEAGADFLVIGRPIIAAPDPVEAVKKILEEIK
jgi:orotidine-5'-phosphate decarboxylase